MRPVDEIYRFYYVSIDKKKTRYFAKCCKCGFRIFASTKNDMEERMIEHYFEIHHNPMSKRPISKTKTPGVLNDKD